MQEYDPKKIENKWQKFWQDNEIYKVRDTSDKPKCYVLDMFPYPSGSGLHVGHPKGYIATDVYSRFKSMSGFLVLHPMGWDAFGLPAENFAIKNKVHPRIAVEENVARYKEQLSMIGFNYDWSREINTTDPEYYRWSQWIFLQLYKKGLAFESHEPINWCPSCKTGLAQEDLETDGTCERCGSQVEKKPMRQWVLKIREYADRLVDDLDKLDQWPDHVKEAQRNWIGRSYGAEIDFSIKDTESSLKIFTTRPDTLFGATYMVIAPEHPLVHELENKIENLEEVKDYIKNTQEKTEIERTDMTKEKTGVELKGVKAINPANQQEIPVWIADYVLADYGTGAIMAVPAHDERDFVFAKKFNISSVEVVVDDLKEELFTGYGFLINSGEFDGLSSEEAKQKITEFVGGKMVTSYRLRDWVFSRQRYWGEPIPMVHIDGKAYPIDESQLPVILPEVESYEPSGTGESPLATIDDWVNVTGYLTDDGDFLVADSAPVGKELIKAKRETNTMPQWAGSCWYYLRYIDPKNDQALVDPAKEKYWQPIDLYVGGVEHATRHLIYARFWHKFLYDIKVVSTSEPFMQLKTVGLIQAADGRKMSKRWGNVINPDDVIAQVGADSLRTYEMFMGPFENVISWNPDGVVGTRRFLEKVWRNFTKVSGQLNADLDPLLHKTIKKVGEDIHNFKFNTAISAMMVFVNDLDKSESVGANQYKMLLQVLAPFAPHMTEELWNKLGETRSIHLSTWPQYNPKLIQDHVIELPVQINGKVRTKLHVAADASEDEVKKMVLVDETVQKWLAGSEPKKFIYVTGKIINIVL